MILPRDLTYQDTATECRYLGMQVGSNIPTTTSWNAAVAKLQVRLRIASQKVLTVDQRSLIAGAVIVPNLMFVARHAWPTTENVNDMAAMIKNYVWHGQFTSEVTGHRAWLDADLAALPRSTGGLAIPDVRAELYALAATAVSKWAEMGTRHMHIVGDILFHHTATGTAPKVYITPEYKPVAPEGVQRKLTLWAAGRSLIAQAGTPEPDEEDGLKMVVRAAYEMGGTRAEWKGVELLIDCRDLIKTIEQQTKLQRDRKRGQIHLHLFNFKAANSKFNTAKCKFNTANRDQRPM
ncbi:hypothetical protein PR001_g30359 [Phytophthora rubi]|uniref:Uncharacterized protein n=1 Tax=Phytophthora rubi TaxID=129364 RepID=A0A6A3GUI8_9STRA|nr:hypothetical protein PR001_g30359 [Phytophthora rubi]